MTDKIQQARRAEFEGWFKRAKPRVAQDMLDENEFVSRWMFESFNAAMDAVAIQLPELIEPEPPEDAFDDSWRDGYAAADRYRKKCRAAIESTNLGIKVK